MPPSPGLSTTLFQNESVESYSPKGPENVKKKKKERKKEKTIYRCTGRLSLSKPLEDNELKFVIFKSSI